MTGTGGEPAVRVQLSVRCGRQAVEFYTRVFEAEEVYRFSGTVDHEDVVCGLRVNGAPYWVEDEWPPDGNLGTETIGGRTERLLLTVADPQGVLERAVGLGATELRSVEEEHRWEIGRPSVARRPLEGKEPS